MEELASLTNRLARLCFAAWIGRVRPHIPVALCPTPAARETPDPTAIAHDLWQNRPT